MSMVGEFWFQERRIFDYGLLILRNRSTRPGMIVDNCLVTPFRNYAYIATTAGLVTPDEASVTLIWGSGTNAPVGLELRWTGRILTPSHTLEFGEIVAETRVVPLASRSCGDAVHVEAYSDDDRSATQVLLVITDVAAGDEHLVVPAPVAHTSMEPSALPALPEGGGPLTMPAAASHSFEWGCMYVGDEGFDGDDVVLPSSGALVGWSPNVATIWTPGPDDLGEFDEELAPRISVFLDWADAIPATHPWHGMIAVPSRRLFVGDANGYGLVDLDTDHVQVAVRTIRQGEFTTGIDVLLIRAA